MGGSRTVPRRRHPGIAVAVAALFAVAAVACNDPVARAPLLDEPREILSRGIEATSLVRTVHVRADLTMRTVVVGQPMAAPDTASIEADIDLGNGELSASGAASDGSGRFGLIVADGATFVQNGANQRWQLVPNVGAGGLAGLLMFAVPAARPPDVKALLQRLVADPRVDPQLLGVEACDGAQCYRVSATIAPEVLWDLIVDALGARNAGIRGGLGAMPAEFPPLSMELAFETSTLVLIETRIAASVEASSLGVIVRLTGHDRPIAIQPPPPGLVDQQRGS